MGAAGPRKKQKAVDSGGRIMIVEKAVDVDDNDDVPATHNNVKSKKELRKEKKASRVAAAKSKKDVSEPQPIQVKVATKEEEKMEKIRLRKLRRNQFRMEEAMEAEKERTRERKIRQKKKRQRELNGANGGAGGKQDQARAVAQKEKKSPQEQDLDIFNNLFTGSTDETTGYTTLGLGLKYKDIVVGTGPSTPVKERTLVTVSYKLRAGKFNAILDSSKKFNFRVGKGEVIKAWDIGVIGMRQGGTRHLIVPPKAGYGSRDIGGGPGAILFFEITVLSC
jgi:FKBP-type peptidyl-prolyl cis-trans isomerase